MFTGFRINKQFRMSIEKKKKEKKSIFTEKVLAKNVFFCQNYSARKI